MIRISALMIALAVAGLPATVRADSALLNPASLHATAPAHFRVLFKTTAGSFTVEVTRAWAPAGADRFFNLVTHGFYNGDAFFRILPRFVVQFGLTGNPAVNAAWTNAQIPDDPVKQHNVMGTIAYAAGGPNTRTTQVFINLGNNSRLDAMGFAPFGRVVSGMDTIERLYSGYGQQADQGLITAHGDAYLRAKFPRMDRIISARVVSTH